jgi:hypothetical protein
MILLWKKNWMALFVPTQLINRAGLVTGKDDWEKIGQGGLSGKPVKERINHRL